MKRNTIRIEDTLVLLPSSGEIWMTQHEIAYLFDCFIAKISSNVRSILKTGVLDERKVCRTYYYKNGNSVEQYNLEMITALSFRIKSYNAEIFREWIMKKAMTKEKTVFVDFQWDVDKIFLN